MTLLDRLYVLWRQPGDGGRHVIGELWREGKEFAFGYQSDLKVALDSGFRPLAEFPELRPMSKPYRSAYLFPTFAQRIPSPKRPDYGRLMASWGVEHVDDGLEVLARSGGIQMTDRLELAEYRSPGDDLTRPLLFRIAGTGHHPGASLLKEGDRLELARERDNPVDANATQLRHTSGAIVGRVPRQYAALVARLLDGGIRVDASVQRRLNVPAETGRWVVYAQRHSHSE